MGTENYMATLGQVPDVGLCRSAPHNYPVESGHYCSYFVCWKTQVQRRSVTCSSSYDRWMLYQDLNAHLSDCKAIHRHSRSQRKKKSVSMLWNFHLCFRLISAWTYLSAFGFPLLAPGLVRVTPVTQDKFSALSPLSSPLFLSEDLHFLTGYYEGLV